MVRTVPYGGVRRDPCKALGKGPGSGVRKPPAAALGPLGGCPCRPSGRGPARLPGGRSKAVLVARRQGLRAAVPQPQRHPGRSSAAP